MLLNIKVIPNAKRERIVTDGKITRAYVTAPAEGGRANKALIKLLSKELDVPKSKIEIVKGEKGREKIIKVSNSPKV
ncbi:DUF167 domain-containing protein [Patescibacteria group bacterium]